MSNITNYLGVVDSWGVEDNHTQNWLSHSCTQKNASRNAEYVFVKQHTRRMLQEMIEQLEIMAE